MSFLLYVIVLKCCIWYKLFSLVQKSKHFNNDHKDNPVGEGRHVAGTIRNTSHLAFPILPAGEYLASCPQSSDPDPSTLCFFPRNFIFQFVCSIWSKISKYPYLIKSSCSRWVLLEDILVVFLFFFLRGEAYS